MPKNHHAPVNHSSTTAVNISPPATGRPHPGVRLLCTKITFAANAP